MVEGPTAKAYAIRICENFRDEVIHDVYVRSRRVFIPINELLGRKFTGADSLGKNILIFFDDIAIRLHLMMFGAIHVYGRDEPLLKPMERVRLMLTGGCRKLVVYNAPIVEIGGLNDIVENLKASLGPDPLSSEWSEDRAIENILKNPNEKIGVLLLNQSTIAGVGNILRNEILFRAGVNPERRISDLSMDEIRKIAYYTKKLSEEFLSLKLQGKGIKELLKVYNRFSGFCMVCGGPIKFYRQKPINRKTFICVNCQK
ncbi:MAG: hypothetical protein QXR00_06300 [Candidatus Bathyarchaeia archaeon]